MKLFHKIKKMTVTIIFISLFAIFLVGCDSTKNKGEYPELYSIAVNSLLGVLGYNSHGDVSIEIIEEDSFGRKLFSYSEGETYSLLISQKTNEPYVYYYPDYNFISKKWEGEGTSFTKEEVEDLKRKNDWDKELNESKSIKVEITRKKTKTEIHIEDKDFETIFKSVAQSKGYKGNDTIFRSAIYCTSDMYGRALYYAWGVGRDVNGEGVNQHSLYMDLKLIIIFNPDGSYNIDTSIMELSDMYNYQDALKAFKELNKWNLSFKKNE